MRLQPPAGSAGISSQVFQATCDASDSVGNAVYISGPAVVGVYDVRTVDITDASKAPAIGIIIKKLDATTCIVQITGIVTGVFSGLTPGQHLFVTAVGNLTQTPPSAPVSGIKYIQAVAYAIADDTVKMEIHAPIIQTAA